MRHLDKSYSHFCAFYGEIRQEHFFHSRFCKKVIVKGYEWTFLQKNVDFGDRGS